MISFIRYGWKALPRLIDAVEFEHILEDIAVPESKEVVISCYKKDLNAIPAQYVLQPISDLVPEFENCNGWYFNVVSLILSAY